jgi:hypothetical protein
LSDNDDDKISKICNHLRKIEDKNKSANYSTPIEIFKTEWDGKIITKENADL